MTLEEAILEEQLESEKCARECEYDPLDDVDLEMIKKNRDLADKHKQYATWLVELKRLLEEKNDTAEWIFDENGMDWNIPAWVCSKCHNKNDMIPTYYRGKDGLIKVENPYYWAGSKYCPNCGKKMRKEKKTMNHDEVGAEICKKHEGTELDNDVKEELKNTPLDPKYIAKEYTPKKQ